MSSKNCTECKGLGWLDSEGEPRKVSRGEITPNGVHECENCGGTGWEPVSDRMLVGGGPVTDDHRELKPNGQQKDYVVLTPQERAKGFVRPVRRTYVHKPCGVATTMSQAIAETYARDPYFYSGTFCVGCGKHFPLGPDFLWDDGAEVGS